MKKTTITILLLIATLGTWAGVVDHDAMYRAYLNNDMATWRIELTRYTSQPNLTIDDKIDISNYLYGYIASLLSDVDKNKSEANHWLDLWDNYLNDIEASKGECADIYAYRSAAYSYKAKTHSGGMMVYGPRAMAELNKALNTDSNNALAVALKGNTKFYMPTFVGGNKHEAIAWFEKAISLMKPNNDPLYRWNRCAITLLLAQSYEKTGNTAKAIEVCEAELKREPNFAYMRDIYLPSLTK